MSVASLSLSSLPPFSPSSGCDEICWEVKVQFCSSILCVPSVIGDMQQLFYLYLMADILISINFFELQLNSFTFVGLLIECSISLFKKNLFTCLFF